jgi:hypothetical protein
VLDTLNWSAPCDRDPFLKRQFRPALAAAGIPATVRIHDPRHTYASI